MSVMRLPVIVALCVALTLPAVSAALAAGGDLDPSFGVGGVASHRTGVFEAMAVAPDGKLVLVGAENLGRGQLGFAVHRYRADGELDRSFGRGGKVLTTLSKSGGEDACPESIGALGLQGERIIAAGQSCSSFVLLGYRSR
jgi:hypothetical protein